MINFNVNSSIESEGVVSAQYLEAGIHENVELKNVEYAKTPQGNEYIAFTFENESGKLVHTEWSPKSKDDDQEKLQERVTNQIKRIKQIVTKFVPEDKYVINANNFKEFADYTVKVLNIANKGQKVRLKALYSSNGFVTLPNYSKFQFIESMSIPKEQSKIRILALDKDKMVRPTPSARINNSSNPLSDLDNLNNELSSASNSTPNIDDLPF